MKLRKNTKKLKIVKLYNRGLTWDEICKRSGASSVGSCMTTISMMRRQHPHMVNRQIDFEKIGFVRVPESTIEGLRRKADKAQLTIQDTIVNILNHSCTGDDR